MMTLGATTFTQNPESMTYIQPELAATSKRTLGGVAVFSWGAFQVGQAVTLRWSYCRSALYTALHGIVSADAAVTFDPENGHTYTVRALSIKGEYTVGTTATVPFRKNVELVLVILSEDT